MVSLECPYKYRVCYYSIRFACCPLLQCTWMTSILWEKSSSSNNGSHLLYGWRREDRCMEVYGYPDDADRCYDGEWEYASLIFDFLSHESPPDILHHLRAHHIPRSTRYREKRTVQRPPFSCVSWSRIRTFGIYYISEFTQFAGSTFWAPEMSRFARICEYYFSILFCSPSPAEGGEYARRGHETHPRDSSLQCKKIKSYSSSGPTMKLLVS